MTEERVPMRSQSRSLTRTVLGGTIALALLLQVVFVTDQAAGADRGRRVHLVVSPEGAIVGFDAAGNVRVIRQARGREVPLTRGASGLFLEDPTTGDRYKVAGKLERQGRQVSQTAELLGPGFAVDVTYSFPDQPGAFQIDGSVVDVTGRDRIVDVVFELPLDVTKGVWEDSVVDRVAFAPGAEREVQEHLPLAAVTGPGDEFSLAYAIAPDHPTRFAMSLEPEAASSNFSIRTKFGLSPAAEGPLHSRAPFNFTLDLGVDARWGLRSALQRYYDRSSEWFSSPIDRFGAWQVLPRPYYQEPDNLAFHEGGRGKGDARTIEEYAQNEQWDLNEENDVYTLPYTIVGQNEITDLEQLPEGCTPGRPCENEAIAMQAVDDWDHPPVFFGAPNSPNSYLNAEEHKEVIRNSGIFTADGSYLAQPRTTQWGGHSLTFPSNPNPALFADSDRLTIAKYMLENYVPQMLSNQYVDGIYVDSLWGWGRYFNYRKDHYGAATIPLTYRDQSHPLFGERHVPGLYNDHSGLEYLWELRERLHDSGKILMANGIRTFQDETRAFDAFAVDAFGAEVRFDNLLEAEEDFAFYRSVGYRNPAVGLIYHGLGTNDWDNEADVAALWKQSLLYGFFGASAAISFDEFAEAGPLPPDTEGMTRTEIEYQRRYAPVHRLLMEAGWNPLTGVWDGDEEVRVERYGTSDDFYLVIYNIGDARTVTVEADRRLVDWPRDGRVQEILPDNELSDEEARALTESGTLSLEADEIKVLHLTSRPASPQPATGPAW